MYNEVHPVVLAVVEDKRLSGPKLGPTELVERMGVRDARELPYEYAWVAVVTDALGAAKHQVYTPEDMEKSFAFEALVWRCDPAN